MPGGFLIVSVSVEFSATARGVAGNKKNAGTVQRVAVVPALFAGFKMSTEKSRADWFNGSHNGVNTNRFLPAPPRNQTGAGFQ